LLAIFGIWLFEVGENGVKTMFYRGCVNHCVNHECYY